jgi:heat shock protein HslJ
VRSPKQLTAILLTLALFTAAGCSREESRSAAASAQAAEAAVVGTAGESPESAAPEGRLAGTSWRLVQIMSMDDTTDTPGDRELYTLEFGRDGSMTVTADCNTGTGSWSSESPGQLRFGVIAATQAECAPDSLHGKYMNQFQWVRSYVIERGHLFLATMADGSIIELEPVTGGGT